MRILLTILLVAVAASCATTGGSRSGNPDRLTEAEIQQSDLVNGYDIVRTLRPRWLRVRGQTSVYMDNPIVVYVDGMRMGGPESLEDIPRLMIQTMRYYSPAQAQARWGLNHTNGAIEVIIGG